MIATERTGDGPGAQLNRGVVLVDDPYPTHVIERWNDTLDPLFAERLDAHPRAYVSCDELHEAGILDEVLSPAVRALVRRLCPDAVIYHCLASETPARRRTPHVSKTDPGGWHRDSDALAGLHEPTCMFFSLMIYLTDVPSARNGAFEGVLGPRDREPETGAATRVLLGSAGTTWLFDRCAVHRVHANGSEVRRRLIKLSFQSNRLPNHHLDEGRFAETLHSLERRGDDYLSFMFGANHPAEGDRTALPNGDTRPPTTLDATPNSTYLVTPVDRLTARYHRLEASRWGADLMIRKARGLNRRLRRTGS